MFCAQQACWPYLVSSKSDCKYVAELRQIRGGTTCIRSATCLYLTKITAKMWLYQQEQTYPQSGLPRPHKATVRPSRRKSTPRSTTGLGFDQVCPLLTSPPLVGLDGRPPSSRDFAWPRCFAHAWPFQRRWVYAGYAQMIALAAPVGLHPSRILRSPMVFPFVACFVELKCLQLQSSDGGRRS